MAGTQPISRRQRGEGELGGLVLILVLLLAGSYAYLSARIAGLRESMKRFDALRGKTVAKNAPIEQRPLGHTENEERPKDPLH